VLNGELTMDSIKRPLTIKDGELLNIDGVEYSVSEILKKFGDHSKKVG
jgi:hypothetical protein